MKNCHAKSQSEADLSNQTHQMILKQILLLHRPRNVLRLVVAVCLPLAVWSQFREVLLKARFAEPVTITLRGIEGDTGESVRIFQSADNVALQPFGKVAGAATWRLDDNWLFRIIIKCSPAAWTSISGAKVDIGNRRVELDRDELQQDWLVSQSDASGSVVTENPVVTLQSPEGIWIETSQSIIRTRPLNWPGDGVIASHIIGQTLLYSLPLYGILFLPKRSPRLLRLAQLKLRLTMRRHSRHSDSVRSSAIADIVGIAFLMAAFCFLELRTPFFFVQDDVPLEEFPLILVGCRGVWSGHLPEWNPYVGMGVPLWTRGASSLTYPPLYLSYAIARHIVGNEYTTMEVFALLHLVAGFLLCRRVCTIVGCGDFAAVVASLSFVLSGPILILGRGWHNFMPLVVWTPGIALCLELLRRHDTGWKWLWGTAGCLAMPIHVGFPQCVVIYFGLFAGILMAIVLGRCISWRAASKGIAASVLAVALGFPVLWHQIQFSKGVKIQPLSSWSAKPGLAAMLLPSPLMTANPPFEYSQRPDFTHFYFVGGVLAVCWLAGSLLVVGRKFSAWDSGPRLWWWTALVFLALSIGDEAGLWRVLGELPIMGNLARHPIRVLPFFVFGAVVSGGFVFDRLWMRMRDVRFAHAGVATAVFASLGYHLTRVDTAIAYNFFKPYPDVSCAGQLLGAGSPAVRRICSFTLNWAVVPSWDPHRAIGESLGANMAGVHKIMALNVYDPIAESLPAYRHAIRRLQTETPTAVQRYGVEWLIAHEQDASRALFLEGTAAPDRSAASSTPWPVYSPWGDLTTARFAALLSELRASSDDGMACGDLRWFKAIGADAMAYPRDTPQAGLPFRVHTEGVDVDVSNSGGGDVVINFLRLENMVATVDGRSVACQADDWGRILVAVPSDVSELAIRYRPDWARAIYGALAIASTAVLGFVFANSPRPTQLATSEPPAMVQAGV